MVLVGVHEKFREYLCVSCTQKHGRNRGYKIGVIVSGRASIGNERLPRMKMKARRCREPMDTVYMGNGRAHTLPPVDCHRHPFQWIPSWYGLSPIRNTRAVRLFAFLIDAAILYYSAIFFSKRYIYRKSRII